MISVIPVFGLARPQVSRPDLVPHAAESCRFGAKKPVDRFCFTTFDRPNCTPLIECRLPDEPGGIVVGYRGPKSRELKPLRSQHPHIPKTGVWINRWPAFAIRSKDIPLQTNGMYGCSALVIQGPGNQHYMSHLNSFERPDILARHLKRDIPWDLSDPATRIQLVPGTEMDTETTVNMVFDALRLIKKSLLPKVEFWHFPDVTAELNQDPWGLHDFTVSRLVSVVSYKGKLFYRRLAEALPAFQPGGRRMHRTMVPSSE